MTTPTQGEHAQPEALRLANALDHSTSPWTGERIMFAEAAAELRRLHAQVAALTAAQGVPRVELELPMGDSRTARAVFSEMKGDTLHICITVDDATAQPAAPQGGAYAELPDQVAWRDSTYHCDLYYQPAYREGLAPLFTADQMRDFADRTHALRASHGQAPAATVIKKGADRQWMSERLGHLPDGIYSLYLAPTAQPAPAAPPQADSQPEDENDAHNFDICQHFDHWLLEKGALLTPHSEESDGPMAPALNWIASVEAMVAARATADSVLDEREAFEAWFRQEYHSRLDRNMPDKSYNDPKAYTMWIAWQARAARATADSVTAPAGGTGPKPVTDADVRNMSARVISGQAEEDELVAFFERLVPPCPVRIAQADSVLEDAARYRWLRDECNRDYVEFDDRIFELDTDLNAAIDAALAQKEGK